MNAETESILSDDRLLAARSYHFERLERLFAGEALETPFFINGINGQSEADPYSEPERWVKEALDFLARRAEEAKDVAVFRPLCLMFRPYCLYFIEPMFGAKTRLHEGQWWADPLKSRVGTLARPDLEADATWRLAKRVAEAFVSRNVSSVLFSMPTIQGALNTAVNLYGGEFLTAMLGEPEAALHDLEVINDVLLEINRWYIGRIPPEQLQPTLAHQRCQPPGSGQTYGCVTEMVSEDLYRNVAASTDEDLLSVYARGGMIHLCGAHTRHIHTWGEMESLRAVQINGAAANDLANYFHGLRDDQIVYFLPSAKISVEEALEITGGRRTVFIEEESP